MQKTVRIWTIFAKAEFIHVEVLLQVHLEIVSESGFAHFEIFARAGHQVFKYLFQSGREGVPLHKQLLMTLHFNAHESKYLLTSLNIFKVQTKYLRCRQIWGVLIHHVRVCAHVLYVLADELLTKYMQWPSDAKQRETAEFYDDKYSFPGVVGAIDGTHIQIATPPDRFFPQDFFSIRTKKFTMNCQITAVQDLRFSSVDVRHPGKDHDAHEFRASDLWFESGERVESVFASADFHIVGDAAYPIKSYLLKLYRDIGCSTPGQWAFNHRLSCVQVVSERAIGWWKGKLMTTH